MNFPELAHDVYLVANQRAMYWQLGRLNEANPLINTKLNSLSLQDYNHADGLRGPNFIYGWIQGRGLEALILHAKYFENSDQQLSHRLFNAAEALYPYLRDLIQTQQGAYFCYNSNFEPVCNDDPSGQTRQQREVDIATYSDLFCVKGLIAAATQFAPEHLPTHLSSLKTIIDAIEHERFLMRESGNLTEAALTEQSPDFGPRMIALGAAALLHQLGLGDHDSFSERFVEHIMDHHLNSSCGVLSNEPGGNIANAGHGIEFAGFALDIHRESINKRLANQLANIINASFKAAFNSTGIATSINLNTMEPINSVCPWWSLPETIRAAALAYEATGNPILLETWETAHKAFFTHYWRGDPPIAFQSLTIDGPVDAVPSTPDLDPGYHTGLSLLGAMQMAKRQSSRV